MEVNILPAPMPYLGPDTIICRHTALWLDAGVPGATYLWDDSSTNQTRVVAQSGTYFVQVTAPNGCSASDTINVEFSVFPIIDLGPDTAILQGTTLTLDAGVWDGYQWSTGATTQQITVDTAGIYSVNVIDENGCEGSGSITISLISSIEEMMPGIDFSVFPNPTDGFVYITLNEPNSGEWSLTLTDVQGRVVAKDVIQSNSEEYQLSLADLAAGFYFVTVENAENTFIQKLVKL